MAAPFVLGACLRPFNYFLKLKPLSCFVKSSKSYVGGCLANTSFYSTAANNNAVDLPPTASEFTEPFRNQSSRFSLSSNLRGWPWQHGRQHDGFGAHLNGSVWHQRESLQFGQHKYGVVQTRQFRTNRSGSPPEDVIKQEPNKSDPPPAHSVSEHSGWMLRFSNDNCYASFCRNAYLSVIVAFTVELDETPVVFAREVSMLFLLIGVTQILYGTATFLYTTIFLRQQMCMSRIASFGICSFAMLHLFLWIFAVAVFQSVNDDDDGSDDLGDVDKNRERRFKQFKKV